MYSSHYPGTFVAPKNAQNAETKYQSGTRDGGGQHGGGGQRSGDVSCAEEIAKGLANKEGKGKGGKGDGNGNEGGGQ